MGRVIRVFVLLAGLVAAGFAFSGVASAASRTAVAGVIEHKGKPTLVIAGTRRMETFQITRYSAIPDGEDPVNGTEVPVYSVSEDLNGMSVAADSLPGRCWGSVYVYCRAAGIKTVIADLGAGNDSLLAAKNLQVKADGGPGNDSIYGGSKNDVLIGGPGRDYLQGGGGDDVLKGGAGNDTLNGDTWRDAVFFKPYAKPAGRDRIDGGAGDDTIQGGAGADVLIGGPGNDGFENNRDGARDRISGGAGRDTLRDPDLARRGRKIRFLDRVSGFEALYLEFTRYRLR